MRVINYYWQVAAKVKNVPLFWHANMILTLNEWAGSKILQCVSIKIINPSGFLRGLNWELKYCRVMTLHIYLKWCTNISWDPSHSELLHPSSPLEKTLSLCPNLFLQKCSKSCTRVWPRYNQSLQASGIPKSLWKPRLHQLCVSQECQRGTEQEPRRMDWVCLNCCNTVKGISMGKWACKEVAGRAEKKAKVMWGRS